MLLLCFKLSSCLVGKTRDTCVMCEKVKFVCLYLLRPQKIKSESGQINMKHVLYNGTIIFQIRLESGAGISVP